MVNDTIEKPETAEPMLRFSDFATLWTYKDCAQFLSMSENTLRRHTAAGLVPHLKVGPRLVRFVPAVVQEWAAQKARGEEDDEVEE